MHSVTWMKITRRETENVVKNKNREKDEATWNEKGELTVTKIKARFQESCK